MIILDSLSTISSAAGAPSADSVFGFWPIMGAIIAGLIGIILGHLFNPLIAAIGTKLFSKFNSVFFRRRKKLSGSWEHVWHVESTRFPRENRAKLKLKQFRKTVATSYIVKDLSGVEYTYAMKGTIENDNYVSGEWYDVYAGHTYHGTFMLYIDVNMDRMEGIWIGKSQDNKVKSGKWEWKRQ